MRSPVRASTIVAATIAVVIAALPAAAQEASPTPGASATPGSSAGPSAEGRSFELPAGQAPVQGFTRSDGTIVLSDEGFCSYLLGATLGQDELTFIGLVDRSKRQKKARRAAFLPGSDADVLGRCVGTLNAFRTAAPDDESVADWARTSPVVPEALAFLLPADLAADPLAQPEPIGDGARTSGFGARVSAPFGLTGGAYYAQVDAPGCAGWLGTLRSPRDPGLELAPLASTGYIYDVPPGNYYWDIQAPDCDWSVDLVLVDLGPEPTATPAPRAVVPQLVGEVWNRGQNDKYLTAEQARAALVAAGLEATCTQESGPPIPDRQVWKQDPVGGTLVEPGSSVAVWIGQDCDVIVGDRIILH